MSDGAPITFPEVRQAAITITHVALPWCGVVRRLDPPITMNQGTDERTPQQASCPGKKI